MSPSVWQPIRNHFITALGHGWGKWISAAFSMPIRQVRNLLTPKQQKKERAGVGQLRKVQVAEEPVSRMGEDMRIVVELLKVHLVMKSGTRSSVYRTYKGKEGLYIFFCQSLYSEVLKRQMINDPQLLLIAQQTAELDRTRFQRNLVAVNENKPNDLKSPHYQSFYKGISPHIKLYFDRTAHPCPICSKLALVRGKLLRWTEDDKKYATTLQKSKLREKTKQKLEKALTQCLEHEKQMQTQRKLVTKILETELSQTVGLVYIDFVGHYYPGKSDDNNSKLNQLCFVFMFLDEDELVTTKYASVLGEDRSDSEFVIRAWETLLDNKSGPVWLRSLEKIYVARDNGAHFRNADLMYFESSFQQRFRKEICIRALASYHAYNRCDAMGSVCKKYLRLAHCSEEGCECSPDGYQQVLKKHLNPEEYCTYVLQTKRATGTPEERKERKRHGKKLWGNNLVSHGVHILIMDIFKRMGACVTTLGL